MAKVQELITNKEVEPCFYRQTHVDKPRKHDARKPRSRCTDPCQWLQASVPALYGPSANKPWVQALRQKIHTSIPQN